MRRLETKTRVQALQMASGDYAPSEGEQKTRLYPPDQTRYLLSRPDIVTLGDVDDAAEGVGYHEDGILHVAEGELQLAAHRTEHSPIYIRITGHSGTSAKTPRTAWLLGSCLGCMNPSTKNPRPVVARIVDSRNSPSVSG